MLFCMSTCSFCVIRVGKARRVCTARKFVHRHRSLGERRRQNVRGRHRILNGEVDADAADGRHGMRRIADESRPGLYQLVSRSTRTVKSFTSSHDRISPMRSARYGATFTTPSLNTSRPAARTLSMRALRDHVGQLPVLVPVDHHQDAARIEPPHRVRRDRSVSSARRGTTTRP